MRNKYGFSWITAEERKREREYIRAEIKAQEEKVNRESDMLILAYCICTLAIAGTLVIF